MALVFDEDSSDKAGGGGDLIPAKSLVFAVVTVRGKKQGKNFPFNWYADIEATVSRGPFTRRKFWFIVQDPETLKPAGDSHEDAEKARANIDRTIGNMSRMMESACIVVPGNKASYANGPKTFDQWMSAINGKECGFEIGIEPGKNGYKDKNRVDEFLSPNPKQNMVKKWQALQSSLQGSGAAPSAQAAAPTGRPAWMDAAPQKDPPFN
jgi:hypothetical protein